MCSSLTPSPSPEERGTHSGRQFCGFENSELTKMKNFMNILMALTKGDSPLLWRGARGEAVK